ADCTREPRALRPALSSRGVPRADRDAPRALRALGRAARPRRVVLPRDDAAARALPRPAPRADAARPRPALHPPRRAGRRASGRAACRAPRRAHLRRLHPRPRTRRAPRDDAPRAGMTYFRDVRALARKDLLLELRARDTLPAMLLFVVAVF